MTMIPGGRPEMVAAMRELLASTRETCAEFTSKHDAMSVAVSSLILYAHLIDYPTAEFGAMIAAAAHELGKLSQRTQMTTKEIATVIAVRKPTTKAADDLVMNALKDAKKGARR